MPRKMTPANAIRMTASKIPTGTRPATSQTTAHATAMMPATLPMLTGFMCPLRRLNFAARSALGAAFEALAPAGALTGATVSAAGGMRGEA
ncbi:MAG: hypothetical protein WDN06_20795 [Asticcacaulis sp.]